MKRLHLTLGLSLLLGLVLALPAQARPEGETTLKVLGSNGQVTVGVRHTYGAFWNDGQESWYDEDQQDTMVYTTDGVNWKTGDAGDLARTYTDKGGTHTGIRAYHGYWDGARFLVWDHFENGPPTHASTDGIHWTAWSGPVGKPLPRGAADLGPYRFQIDPEQNVWLMDRQGRGLILPGVQGGPYMSVTDIQAYYGPNGAVTLELYDTYGWEGDGGWKAVFHYTTASLDWCLEHLAQPMTPWTDQAWYGTPYTAGAGVILARTRVGDRGVEYWRSTDGANWTPLTEGPWLGGYNDSRLLPYNGKTFLIQDGNTLGLYASEDGLHWRTVEGFGPPQDAPGSTVAEYRFWWTGDGYVMSCRVAEGRYGMMGMRGGEWYSPYCTRVTFYDAGFRETGHYDFRRQVRDAVQVGGTCYAQVSDSEGVKAQEYHEGAGHTIYASTDRVNWTATTLTALPEARPPHLLADPYYLRLTGEQEVWISTDGVNYGRLPDLPKAAEGEPPTDNIAAYAGADGLLVLGRSREYYTNMVGELYTDAANGVRRTYTKAELDAALAGAAPQA